MQLLSLIRIRQLEVENLIYFKKSVEKPLQCNSPNTGAPLYTLHVQLSSQFHASVDHANQGLIKLRLNMKIRNEGKYQLLVKVAQQNGIRITESKFEISVFFEHCLNCKKFRISNF